MVSVVRLHPQGEDAIAALGGDLPDAGRELVARALGHAEAAYAGQQLSSGEPVWPHALGLAGNLAAIGADAATRAAGILFAAPKYAGGPDPLRPLREGFGDEVAGLAAGVEKLYQLRIATRRAGATASRDEQARQSEVLRKMVLAMVEDIRVVLIRLASRTQTLRWFARAEAPERRGYARETLDIYAPLANRLGVWQLKWEMEDLSFRFLEPETYRRIAGMLDEKRAEREQYIRAAIGRLAGELESAGIGAQISGRPKHIYSIWSKMRAKDLDFSEVHDVRALRVIVDSDKDCYAALGVVHHLWAPIASEFDDYIRRPKNNDYRSLHSAVVGPEDRTLEVQIRTLDMHRHAEFGVAAHWRYKESGGPAKAESAFDRKIAWLRSLLAWREELPAGSRVLEDTVYVLTPQGRVLDLPAGSTPIDFAYALHTDLGHRCRGARADGQMVPLDTPLANGQRVEIVAAKSGGPSRDWLIAERGFIRSHRARHKIRQWFNAQALTETVASGRATVERALKREGSHASLENLAAKLGFGKPDELFAAVARDEINLRQLQLALREFDGDAPAPAAAPARAPGAARGKKADSGVLVVGIDRLLTQMARCCKPLPPDPIRGFVTRGKGVSVHREDCASLRSLAERSPERIIEADWGKPGAGDARRAGAQAGAAFTADLLVVAADRQGLLRDISDTLARERLNVTAVRTRTHDDVAHMRFSVDVSDLAQLRRALAAVKQVPGVIRAARG